MDEKIGSPGVSPVQLNNCLHDLLKFVLQSSVNGTLGFNLNLSADFCSGLLKHDDIDYYTDFTEGVPSYPLYKSLASALEQWIVSGPFVSTSEDVPPLCEDQSFKEMKDNWNKLISQKGSQLVDMLKSIKFELHVQEPYFTQLKDGMKIVEGRCAVGNYNRIQSGDIVFFNKCLMLAVQDVRHYSSFLEMLGSENLEHVLPGVGTIEEGEKIYRKFYTKEKEQLNGVLAICVCKPDSQPYFILCDIISGLGYRGIQSLLGLKQTVGTIPEALPPPRSILFSSFASVHNSNIKGSTLTAGARALTKHVNRCSNRFWGYVEGNDSIKNQLAVEVITRIISRCQWMNVYIVQPHGSVFEIRISDGYGARWSKDGATFIGFLEPYMEEGHSKRWRH
ncbi:unnamed protein product [Amaranthus hypochondriacus]